MALVFFNMQIMEKMLLEACLQSSIFFIIYTARSHIEPKRSVGEMSAPKL